MLRTMLFGVVVALMMSHGAMAVEGNQVELHGSTVKTIPVDSVGVLDMSSPRAMVFRAAGAAITLPYAGMREVTYTSDVARHLGVLPAIAVGMVRKRQRRHYITVTYEDGEEQRQIMVLEVPKTMPCDVLAMIQVRAPQACGANGFACRRPEEF